MTLEEAKKKYPEWYEIRFKWEEKILDCKKRSLLLVDRANKKKKNVQLWS